MTTRSKQLAKLLIRALITAGLLVWVFSQIDLGQFGQAVKTARWQLLIAVWVLTVIFFWIRSIKMQLILKKQDCTVGIATIFRASAVTSLYSMILPGVLSTGAKWYILKKDSGKGSNVLSSMVYNQLLTMFVMIVFGLAALMITNPILLLKTDVQNRWLLPLICGILLTVIILISLLLLSSRTGGKIIDGFGFLLRPFPVKIRQKGREILDQIATFQTAGAGFHLKIASVTTIDTLIGGVIIYVLSARAANVTAPAGVLVWICAAICVLGRVPISVANLGVREVTLVGLLGIYGVEKSQALLMSMILFSALVLMAIIGAMYQIYWAVSSKKNSSARR
ncbi:MAG TPA: lysylphosphatidylglycerol synthase transmembrane domain-containing protein [Sedimentisphaerales bacterium]|nr:lysylphosphatidylglycerol synthase transmembrane domain-containing protein [Sedimentisphaerales bacterium]